MAFRPSMNDQTNIYIGKLSSFQSKKKKLIMKRESSIMLIAYGWFQINSFMSMGDNSAMKHCLLIDFQL